MRKSEMEREIQPGDTVTTSRYYALFAFSISSPHLAENERKNNTTRGGKKKREGRTEQERRREMAIKKEKNEKEEEKSARRICVDRKPEEREWKRTLSILANFASYSCTMCAT